MYTVIKDKVREGKGRGRELEYTNNDFWTKDIGNIQAITNKCELC